MTTTTSNESLQSELQNRCSVVIKKKGTKELEQKEKA